MEDGYTTIKILEAEEISVFRQAFQEAIRDFPEFKRHDLDPLRTMDNQLFGSRHSNYVMGGFGAFGNPSAFHNPYVRSLRLLVHTKMVPFFGEYLRYRSSVYDPSHPDFPVSTDGFCLEQLFCRMCLRPEGTSVTREQWHRDLNPTATPDDIVFGGWLNLDDTAQKFSCAPGTHNDVIDTARKTSGFTRQTAPSVPKRIVAVPPGYLLLFYQRLLHEVAPKMMRSTSYRQFICWRITRHPDSSLQRDPITHIVDNQSVPRLPSDQVPFLYGSNHASFHLHKENGPIRWSQRVLHDKCLQNKGGYMMAHRPMKSLRDYEFPMYPPYHPMEVSILTPHSEWDLPDISTFTWTPTSIADLSILRHTPTPMSLRL